MLFIAHRLTIRGLDQGGAELLTVAGLIVILGRSCRCESGDVIRFVDRRNQATARDAEVVKPIQSRSGDDPFAVDSALGSGIRAFGSGQGADILPWTPGCVNQLPTTALADPLRTTPSNTGNNASVVRIESRLGLVIDEHPLESLRPDCVSPCPAPDGADAADAVAGSVVDGKDGRLKGGVDSWIPRVHPGSDAAEFLAAEREQVAPSTSRPFLGGLDRVAAYLYAAGGKGSQPNPSPRLRSVRSGGEPELVFGDAGGDAVRPGLHDRAHLH